MKITDEKGKFIQLTKKQFVFFAIFIFLIWLISITIYIKEVTLPQIKEDIEQQKKENYEIMQRNMDGKLRFYNYSSMNVSDESELLSSEDSSSSSS